MQEQQKEKKKKKENIIIWTIKNAKAMSAKKK